MALYAIGDIQGCYAPFRKLLDQIAFDPDVDQLWLAGDLVNRGPESLKTLEFVMSLGESCRVVLGNHDLHLLAVATGAQSCKRKDTFTDVLEAENLDEIIQWIRTRPILCLDRARKWVMTHAGIPYFWSLDQAVALANELEAVLQGDHYLEFLQQMYGNDPSRWVDHLSGQERLRVITNVFTRMRFVAQDGTLDMKCKQGVEQAPEGYRPWFQYGWNSQYRQVFGHWAALQGNTGLDQFLAVDTGCIWGGPLSAFNLDTLEVSRYQEQN